MHSYKKMWDYYSLTDAERDYWQAKEDALETPLTYQYADGYGHLVSMSGIYRICMLVTMFMAVCMSVVFAEEHNRKTDQLILCSRLGRCPIYFAKVLAGSLVSFVAAFVLFLVEIAASFWAMGTDGFYAAIQMFAGYYSLQITVGEVFLIMTGILFLSTIVTSIFTMVLSEITHSSIASMVVLLLLLFGARLIMIPKTLRVLSQFWNYIPINLLKFDEGFTDLRLISVGNLQLTGWQFAPVLYVVLGALLVLVGRKAYCRYQVTGR